MDFLDKAIAFDIEASVDDNFDIKTPISLAYLSNDEKVMSESLIAIPYKYKKRTPVNIDKIFINNWYNEQLQDGNLDIIRQKAFRTIEKIKVHNISDKEKALRINKIEQKFFNSYNQKLYDGSKGIKNREIYKTFLSDIVKKDNIIFGHNIHTFDLPSMNKYYKEVTGYKKQLITSPNIKGFKKNSNSYVQIIDLAGDSPSTILKNNNLKDEFISKWESNKKLNIIERVKKNSELLLEYKDEYKKSYKNIIHSFDTLPMFSELLQQHKIIKDSNNLGLNLDVVDLYLRHTQDDIFLKLAEKHGIDIISSGTHTAQYDTLVNTVLANRMFDTEGIYTDKSFWKGIGKYVNQYRVIYTDTKELIRRSNKIDASKLNYKFIKYSHSNILQEIREAGIEYKKILKSVGDDKELAEEFIKKAAKKITLKSIEEYQTSPLLRKFSKSAYGIFKKLPGKWKLFGAIVGGIMINDIINVKDDWISDNNPSLLSKLYEKYYDIKYQDEIESIKLGESIKREYEYNKDYYASHSDNLNYRYIEIQSQYYKQKSDNYRKQVKAGLRNNPVTLPNPFEATMTIIGHSILGV